MPRAFDEREKEWIRNRLVEEGKNFLRSTASKRRLLMRLLEMLAFQRDLFIFFIIPRKSFFLTL